MSWAALYFFVRTLKFGFAQQIVLGDGPQPWGKTRDPPVKE